MMALEESLQCTVDETKFAAATTVADLQELTRPIEGHAATAVQVESIEFPSWSRSTPIRALRRVSLPTWILPLARVFVKLEVRGLEHLERLSGPVIFAANHQSHLDTPVILMSLPARWRYRVAPAMAKEFFKAHFYPEQFGRKAWFTNSLNYYLASTFFNAFPLPQRETGTRQTLRYIGDLFAKASRCLSFRRESEPTKERSTVSAGVGMIASRLDVPVVPVRLDGLDRVLHQSWKFPQRGPARITFLPPMSLKGNDYAAIAREVEETIRNSNG
jgi:long-chain acyl-CoA synthetase